jgi:FKBP-type peptidyl-prolyl cis-trans isomerase
MSKIFTSVIIAMLVLTTGAGMYSLLSPNKTTKAEVANSSSSAATVNRQVVSEDIVAGTGDSVLSGNYITVKYKGELADGTVFDETYTKAAPKDVFTFQIGKRYVIAGWDQGLIGMKVGGKRKLTIPPELGYGSQKVGPIPANSTLIFNVELINIQK